MEFEEQIKDVKVVTDNSTRTYLRWSNTEAGRDKTDCFERIAILDTVIYVNIFNRNLRVTKGHFFWDKLEKMYSDAIKAKPIGDKKTYTSYEVAELLAAYRNSDSGNRCMDEVKREWRNSFPTMAEDAEKWLNNVAYLSVKEKAEIWFNQRDAFYQEQLLRKHNTPEEAYCEIFRLREAK